MVEKFNKKERKVLKHAIRIYATEFTGNLNSLMDIFNDYGRPDNKCPTEKFKSPIPLEGVLGILPKDLQKKIRETKPLDYMVDTEMAISYLKEMDIENFNNPDMWVRFSEIENEMMLLSEILKDEEIDNSQV